MAKKKRLDVLVYEQGLAPSREMAQRYIMAGEITVDGQVKTKPGSSVAIEADIRLKQAAQFVSRGGLKLQTALDAFSVSIAGKVCVDVGASTGGFTDCLLQHGAQKVYAIDVGYGQLALKLRNDERVVVMERVNARHVENLPEPIGLAVMDVSFISIRLLFEPIRGWLAPQADLITLIKPQFEAGKKEVDRGEGIIKDTAIHRQVLQDVLSVARTTGYTINDLTTSAITGAKGNIEFLAWLSVGYEQPSQDIETLIASTMPQDQYQPTVSADSSSSPIS